MHDTGLERDDADTGTNMRTGVLNSTGHLVEVAATGVHVILPRIHHVGMVRQRYPIANMDLDGNNIWKEVQALRHLVMNSDSYSNIFAGQTNLRATALTLSMGKSRDDTYREHTHFVRLTAAEVTHLATPGNTAVVYTSYSENHFHTLKIKYTEKNGYEYVKCDRNPEFSRCDDKHDVKLDIVVSKSS